MKNHICIDKIRQDLIKRDPDTKSIYFELATIESITNGVSNSEYKTGQAIEVAYEYQKRSGEVVIKHRKSFVTHIFCPFCGNKYE
jgi:hypothetical protein